MELPTKQRTVGSSQGNLEALEILVTRINKTNRRRNRTLVTRVLEGTIRRKAKATVKAKEKATVKAKEKAKEKPMKLMLLMRP